MNQKIGAGQISSGSHPGSAAREIDGPHSFPRCATAPRESRHQKKRDMPVESCPVGGSIGASGSFHWTGEHECWRTEWPGSPG